jgi:hypothetical protein
MARLDLEIAAFKSCTSTYRYRDFVWLIGQLGYGPKKAGKTAGSRRKFYNTKSGHLIVLDEPHDGEMRKGMVKRLQQDLQDKGVI